MVEHGPDGNQYPICWSPFCHAFERFVYERCARQPAQGGGVQKRRNGGRERRRHPAGKPGIRAALTREVGRKQHGQCQETRRPCHITRPCSRLTLTTLFLRPKPSSTVGAAGSTTHRCPSTTKAY